MYDDEYYEEEENVHVISDQDSTDDKPQIESIIHETIKRFQNESYIIKILLSQHYVDFRRKFFEGIKHTNKSIFQAIKKEIRNNLNPYRIFVAKDTKTSKELSELYDLLKGYYKERNFNNTFFINYFKDLEEAHKKKKSKIINMLPKDEIETLNDIQRKVTIIKNLRHYLNTTICDRIQTNYDQKKEMFENDYFIMMYKYLVIDEDYFSKMDDKELFKYLSNQSSSYKLRRPLNDFNVYNYIPILCKGYCQKEAEMFIDKFNKSINNHVDKTGCTKCKEITEHLSKINDQIKSIYLKTCIFSHNINEIMFHPLMFFSLAVYLPFYQKQFNKKPIGEIEQIVTQNTIPKRFKNLKGFDINNIYNPADVGMKKIYNLLVEYAKNKGLYGNCCYLSEYKTEPGKIDFKPDNYDYYIHMKKCPYYHSNLEKRRINKNLENEICKEVIKDGKWINNENIKCNKKDYCNKYHTRNELFFDEKNYRKLYPCTEPYYCEKGDLCPKKHATDIKIEELYLPIKNKIKLEEKLKELNKKNNRMLNKLNKFSNAMCKSCLNFIDGSQGRSLYIFNRCHHVICSKCYDYYNSCPLCGFNEEDNDDSGHNNKNAIFIKIDKNLIFKNQSIKDKNKSKSKDESKKKEKKDSDDNSSDVDSSLKKSDEDKKKEKNEDENEEDSSEDDNNDKNDNDLTDYKNINDNDYDDQNLQSDISDLSNVEYPDVKNDISINSMIDNNNGENKNHSRKGVKRGKRPDNNNDRRDRDRRNNNYYQNYNDSFGGGRRGYNSRGRFYRYRYREGRGSGRGRYRGGGRGRLEDIYNDNDNDNDNDNYIFEQEEGKSFANEINDNSSFKRGKGRIRGKSNYNNSDRNEDEKSSKDNNSKKSKSDDDDDENEDQKEVEIYKEEFSMRLEYDKRSRGVLRGGRNIRGGRGNKQDKRFEEDSDSDKNEISNTINKSNKKSYSKQDDEVSD